MIILNSTICMKRMFRLPNNTTHRIDRWDAIYHSCSRWIFDEYSGELTPVLAKHFGDYLPNCGQFSRDVAVGDIAVACEELVIIKEKCDDNTYLAKDVAKNICYIYSDEIVDVY